MPDAIGRSRVINLSGAEEHFNPNILLNFSALGATLLVTPVTGSLGSPTMAVDTDRLYEQLLVLRCQAGDEVAFEEIVGRYGPRLRYYLRKLLEDNDSVDDAIQDVWLDVLKSVTRLAEPAAFSTWLYRIAHARACREFRRRRHLPLDNVEPAARGR
jgi:hypothetical protein